MAMAACSNSKIMALKNFIIQIYLSGLYFLGFGQSAALEVVGPLAPGLTECSGLVALPEEGVLLAINDSGNEPELFVMDTTGKALQRIALPELRNVDWESLALYQRRLYIADIGNNANRRRKLSIYILAIDSLLSHGHYHYEGEITFYYPDQLQFPPPPEKRYYDAEALIAYEDSLYIFTKNRTEPFDGYSQVYSLPTTAGHYAARWRGKLRTSMGLRPSFWVAGATLHPSGRELYLLGYDKLWIWDQFPGRQFWQGRKRSYFLDQLSQNEGITFAGEAIYIGEESRRGQEALLYKIPYSHLAQASEAKNFVSLPERQFKDQLQLKALCSQNCSIRWELMSTDGGLIKKGLAQHQPEHSEEVIIAMDSVPSGHYIFQAILHGRPHAFFVERQEEIGK